MGSGAGPLATVLRRGGFREFSFGGGRVHDFDDEALAEGVGGAGDGCEGDGGVFGIEQAVELGSDFGRKAGSSSFRLTASRVGMTRLKGWCEVRGSELAWSSAAASCCGRFHARTRLAAMASNCRAFPSDPQLPVILRQRSPR